MLQEPKSLLAGVRVIEMSHVMAAPTTGLMLADMGADVIKVERLPMGDDVRRLEPYVDDESAPFAMMNRNKRSIGLNLKTDVGKAALKRLIEGADVFVENYRQGAMEHYGVGYEQIKDDNLGLIYCSISGYGRTGPYAEKGGFDLVAQGMSGIMSITGESAERPPVKVGAPVTDITAGTLGAMGILGALFHKAQSGEGQFVDTSLFEAGIMHTYWQSAIFMASGELPVAMGSAHPLMAPYQAFQTSDGWLNIGSANQGLWQKLTAFLGVPELADDPRFREPKDRIDNLAELVDELTSFFKTDTTEAWQQKLEAAGIPAGPVLNIEQMTANEQTLARDMVADVGSSEGSSLRVLGHPVKYSETPAAIQRRAPGLGEHTEEVLKEFGFSVEEIAELLFR
jgi:crotonobetainyl-CoA:carnitine CoA-transferase CaiB-like acyl-CoA transferase|tara:strand:- start:975 stop:2165 length:1191 start_codon:yes stop_codon:yes gene_type:complete